MKKIFIGSIIFVFTVLLSTAILLKVYENRIIDSFRKQIIDKTDINFSFSKINLSLFKNFPYCSIILDDVFIYYRKDNQSDTLLSSKNVNFKINTISLFRGIYEFPEIIISDGFVNINGDKIASFFSGESGNDNDGQYLIKTEKVKFKKTRVVYSLGNNFKLNFFVRNAVSSGSFKSNVFKLGLTINVDSLTGMFNKYKFNEDESFRMSAVLLEKNDEFFSENGSIKNSAVDLNFSLKYSLKTDILQTSLSSSLPIEFKNLKSKLFSKAKQDIYQGSFTFNSFYTVDFSNLNTQKLSVMYNIKDVRLKSNKKVTISKINGTTTLYGAFDKNNTDINSFAINYSGLEITGDVKIKDFPKPLLLINVKLNSLKEIEIDNDLWAQGKINGNIKLLAKVNNNNYTDYKSFKIINISSKLSISDFSLSNTKTINSLTGQMTLNVDKLSFIGKGNLYTSQFKGRIDIQDYLKVLFDNKNASPSISVNIDKLNFDSLLANTRSNNETSNTINYFLLSKINSVTYKGTSISELALDLEYRNEKYNCNRFSMNVLSGNLAGSFSYSKKDGINSSLVFQKVDVEKLFKTFNNFDQSIVTSEGIKGSMSGKADVRMGFDKKGSYSLPSLKATSQLIVENGSLSDLSQFEKMSNFLNLKEIKTVQFKTLENTITIENEIVTIPSMKISSNALNLNLSGQHGFNGVFTYWLKINLKEILAKKFKMNNRNVIDYDNDNKSGLNLFIKFIGNSENYKFTFDKKNSLSKITNDINNERTNLKTIIREEFNGFKKDTNSSFDSSKKKLLNKVDTLHNKNNKKPFKIEWEEIDTTKKF